MKKKPKAHQLFRREIRLEDTRIFLFHGYLTPLVRLMNALNIKYFSKFVFRFFLLLFSFGLRIFFFQPTNQPFILCARDIETFRMLQNGRKWFHNVEKFIFPYILSKKRTKSCFQSSSMVISFSFVILCIFFVLLHYRFKKTK